eukprot:TRINITY_DN32102_c0_g1_i1.p3 TRINITY_DN32102_c0_g1~~TRINITY_DN32102_c0_g1_i1.p3  ORF type:complete len:161 (+),score=45.44 TRINITY_DN32102_c0_g1_i1:1-483(+)
MFYILIFVTRWQLTKSTDFFFFKDTATIEIYTRSIVGSVRCVQETDAEYMGMLNSIKKGFINATELADYLVRKGISFRDAHKYSGLAVLFAEKKGINLEDIKIEDYISICPKIKEDVYESLDYKTAILKRISPSSTGYSSVENQLNNWENWIKENERIFD